MCFVYIYMAVTGGDHGQVICIYLYGSDRGWSWLCALYIFIWQ